MSTKFLPYIWYGIKCGYEDLTASTMPDILTLGSFKL